jgi:NAD(P)H-hydrate epimerase
VTEFVRALLDRATCPIVLDADAITVLSDDPDRLTGSEERHVIITPHPGEMARLIGASISDVQNNRLEVATDFATTHRVHVVLKGHRTVIATPEGHVFINPTGNPGMASGGTGDVLTGIVGAFLARGMDAADALVAAVYLHGSAGDLAAARLGEESLIASDVIDSLPDAFAALRQ